MIHGLSEIECVCRGSGCSPSEIGFDSSSADSWTYATSLALVHGWTIPRKLQTKAIRRCTHLIIVIIDLQFRHGGQSLNFHFPRLLWWMKANAARNERISFNLRNERKLYSVSGIPTRPYEIIVFNLFRVVPFRSFPSVKISICRPRLTPGFRQDAGSG